MLVTGAAGSGKSSLKHRLFRKDPPSIRCSTALAEAAIRAVSREIVGTDKTGWFQVTHDQLMQMLGEALRAGVPMEKSSSEILKATVHKQPQDITTDDSKLPPIAGGTVGSSLLPTLKTTDATIRTKFSTRNDSKQSTVGGDAGDSASPLHTLETSEAAVQHKHTVVFIKDNSKQSTVDISQLPRVKTNEEVLLQKPTKFGSVLDSSHLITPDSAQHSLSKQEIVQLIEKSHGSKRFLELQWIHFIDSGGQPQFHEVLPAFIRNTTATIFVMKLSERLNEQPMVEYYDGNGQMCGKPYRHALSNDQMFQCCIQTIHSRPSTRGGKHSKTLVVGTHRDLESTCSESRAKKNRKLINLLTPSLRDRLVHYRLGSEVIFPINTITPDEQDHQVCEMIRKQVTNKKGAPPPYKIPIGWFLLEQDILSVAKGGVISKTECLRIGAILKVNDKALKASLEYFDDLNIFLYFPSILPEVVFADPQVLLNKVTELVHFSYSLQGDSELVAVEGMGQQNRDKGTAMALFGKVAKLLHIRSSRQSERQPVALEGEWLRFRDKGIVTLEMFQDERFSAHYVPDLFTPEDLIKLFQHLLIVAPLSSTEYFMPSLLQRISPEMVKKQFPRPSSSAAPLLVYFPAGCAQNGLFCALVVHLLSKCQWKFACSNQGTPLCVSRSCIRFQIPGKPVSITLVDSFTYFQLHVETLSTKLPKVCPMIRESIFNGLKAAAEALRYNNSTPVPAFFCECSSPPHVATPTIDDDDCSLMCTNSYKPKPLTKQHTVWLSATTDISEGKQYCSTCY